MKCVEQQRYLEQQVTEMMVIKGLQDRIEERDKLTAVLRDDLQALLLERWLRRRRGGGSRP